MSDARERTTMPDGRVYELEPMPETPGSFRVQWVTKCPECGIEVTSPTGGEGHIETAARTYIRAREHSIMSATRPRYESDDERKTLAALRSQQEPT